MARQVTLDFPDDISAVLEGRWPDLTRQALEALAVEAYRTGALTESQVRRLLQLEADSTCTRSSRDAPPRDDARRIPRAIEEERR